ncbi:nicotinate phosphoribosyltransferase [Campylobacter geochelonis]|uniref:Nicotinate phosphoribosyltransferase n=1 Tax=Campylobacter geochelonis TaxID=1780362 RepID=A0A128EBV5_9BACT|nr:nicotinate phosphoribosyltransferase [Campylobacter geochelonis]QKF72075.1 nicotinate phosphoribosyltransferase, subgroup A [Campylobacter geochelonis]CZE45852.1 putative nicotinate phosphoribosyltransferase [Campylobacter geochelonis]CZE46784.1 putative nicotinate phosphoribosyltransferase [Campylobacter geochelonis]CZE49836.1 putative nicotinate phosphoribosyltransferase [Campylobacter geochelonis]
MQDLALLTDFYQLSMMQGYFREKKEQVAVFDMYFRKHPCGGAYAVLCGIDSVVEYISGLKFSKSDIEYLKSLNFFDDEFLNYLENFKFSGEIYAIKEGSIVFAHEPLVRVRAKIIEAQLIETAILSMINFQTLIATKASRVVRSAVNDPVMEFGLRRAQEKDAGVYGSRASVIAGCAGTSNVLAGKMFGLSVLGTHSHSWIQSFDSELEAFRAYARNYPDATVLLVDTYDVLQSGVINAITVFKELREAGHEPVGIRIDSGDLEYLSKQARVMLDEAGFKNAKITGSNDLDEYSIEHLKNLGAKIDNWGVGTKLITSYDHPSLGGVYKLAATQKDGKIEPKIKISNDPRKINNPGFKQIYRLYDKDTNKALADLITTDDEVIDESKEFEIFHPLYTYKRRLVKNFYAKKLLEPLFIDGKFVGKKRSVKEIAKFHQEEKASFWDEHLRNINPQSYKVDLSQKLWEIRENLLQEYRTKI